MYYWRRASVAASFALICALWMILRGASPAPIVHTPAGISPRDRATFSSHVVRGNTLVFVPVNSGMLHLAKNLMCSLSKTSLNVSDIVFWTLDEGAERSLSLDGYATYRDPSLYSVSTNENRIGNTKAYVRMMRERPKFYINILSAGYNILMLDADTVFWQSPLLIVPEADDQVDAVYSTDAREFYQTKNAFQDSRRRGSVVPPICNGVFWMRSNRETVSLWSDMLEIFNWPAPIGWIKRFGFRDDQRGMDVLLNDGRARIVEPLPEGMTANMPGQKHAANPRVKVRLLDQTAVVNGHLLENRNSLYKEYLAKLRSKGEDRMAVHFNWDTEILGKVDGARQHGMWFLDDKGNCAAGL